MLTGEAPAVNVITFEVSWEVVNKGMSSPMSFQRFFLVGGIYTVLKSKAQSMASMTGLDYYLIGPLNEFSLKEVEVTVPPPHLSDAINALSKSNIGVVYGRWLIEGCPCVFLLDIYNFNRDIAIREFSALTSISIDSHDIELSLYVTFGYLVYRFLNVVCFFHLFIVAR